MLLETDREKSYVKVLGHYDGDSDGFHEIT